MEERVVQHDALAGAIVDAGVEQRLMVFEGSFEGRPAGFLGIVFEGPDVRGDFGVLPVAMLLDERHHALVRNARGVPLSPNSGRALAELIGLEVVEDQR